MLFIKNCANSQRVFCQITVAQQQLHGELLTHASGFISCFQDRGAPCGGRKAAERKLPPHLQKFPYQPLGLPGKLRDFFFPLSLGRKGLDKAKLTVLTA